MNTPTTMQTYASKDKTNLMEVKAGRWKQLGDLKELDLVGDGGEARAVKVTEEDLVLVRVFSGEWIVKMGDGETPADYLVFCDEVFHEEYVRIVHVDLNLGMKMTPTIDSEPLPDEKINRPTPHEAYNYEKENMQKMKT